MLEKHFSFIIKFKEYSKGLLLLPNLLGDANSKINTGLHTSKELRSSTINIDKNDSTNHKTKKLEIT